eukprot:15473694-Alexandrium_andersonii.AAC.1
MRDGARGHRQDEGLWKCRRDPRNGRDPALQWGGAGPPTADHQNGFKRLRPTRGPLQAVSGA